MSLEAIAWALTEAPDVPPECVSLLIGLANHADSRGRGAYAGQKLLAEYARKSDRSVRNDLAKLQQRSLIRPGDQALAGHIAADCRPVVYDLALERKQASGRKHSSARQSASAATSDRFTEPQPPDQQEHGGSGSTVPHGSQVPAGSEEQRERKPASYKPTDKPKDFVLQEGEGGSGGDGSASGRKPHRPKRDLNEGRDDALRLCAHLADRIELNTGERPDFGKKWITAARLMLDNDHRTEQQVHAAIDWCQGNEFWRRNILSIPTLRDKYLKLRMQAEAERKSLGNGRAGTGAPGPDRARGWMAAGRAFQEQSEQARKELPA